MSGLPSPVKQRRGAERIRERALWLWEVLADHYRGNGWVAGFNLLNEPADEEGDRLVAWYAEAERRVRAA